MQTPIVSLRAAAAHTQGSSLCFFIRLVSFIQRTKAAFRPPSRTVFCSADADYFTNIDDYISISPHTKFSFSENPTTTTSVLVVACACGEPWCCIMLFLTVFVSVMLVDIGARLLGRHGLLGAHCITVKSRDVAPSVPRRARVSACWAHCPLLACRDLVEDRTPTCKFHLLDFRGFVEGYYISVSTIQLLNNLICALF